MRVARLVGLVSAAWLLSGCLVYGSYPITRTVGGVQRVGVFVTPRQYEDFVRGELAFERGAFDEAADAYQRARSEGDDDVLLLSRLADSLDRLGNRAQAERALATAAALDGHSEIVSMTEGALHERHEEPAEAIASYERAHEAAPHGDAPVLALARVLARAGQADRALALLEEHVRRAPTALSAARASLTLALDRRDVAALVVSAGTIARVAPGHTDELEAAARLLVERGDVLLAHRLLASLPEGSVDRELFVTVAIAAGARADAERLLAFEPSGSPGALVSEARHWLALHEPVRAEELARVVRSEDPTDSSALLVLAEARLAAGAPAEAAELFAAIPVGAASRGEAEDGLRRALVAAGLPALASEVGRDPRVRTAE